MCVCVCDSFPLRVRTCFPAKPSDPFPRHPKSSKYLVSRCLEPLKAFSGDVSGFKYLLNRCLDVQGFVVLPTFRLICRDTPTPSYTSCVLYHGPYMKNQPNAKCGSTYMDPMGNNKKFLLGRYFPEPPFEATTTNNDRSVMDYLGHRCLLVPRDPGSSKLRVGAWNLNTLRFGGDCTPLADPLTFGEPGSLGSWHHDVFFSWSKRWWFP